MVIGLGSVARADGPRIDFSTAFENADQFEAQIAKPQEIAIDATALAQAIETAPTLRTVRVYVSPSYCQPCENQKAAFANLGDIARVEYVVGGPSWVTGFPTVHIVDVNRVVDWRTTPEVYAGGVVSAEGLATILKRLPPPQSQAVGLGSIKVGEVAGREAVLGLIKSAQTMTGQASGSVKIDFEGHGPQAIDIAPSVSIKVRDPLTVRYRWEAGKVEATFSPSTAITVKANGVQSAINGVTADVEKVVIDLPGWLTPDLRINLK